MNRYVEIAVTGSGSLASEILHALALSAKGPVSIALLGRDAARLGLLARSTAARATAVGGSVSVYPVVIDWENDAQICRTIAALRPKVLLHTASLQSPWSLGGDDAWSRLVKDAGYGFTLPLQTVLALRIGRAIGKVSPATLFINACYPDAVNRVLKANGVAVGCGLGNVAILAAMFAADLAFEDDRRLRMIAHHAHVSAGIENRNVEDAPLRAWLDDESIDDLAAKWLRRASLPLNMNSIVGATAAPIVFAALDRRLPWKGHAPGPLGLPGGYPVIVSSDGIELDLPGELDLSESISLNMAAAIADGVAVNQNGDVALSPSSVRVLKEAGVGNIDRLSIWPATEVDEQADSLLTLRESLGKR